MDDLEEDRTLTWLLLSAHLNPGGGQRLIQRSRDPGEGEEKRDLEEVRVLEKGRVTRPISLQVPVADLEGLR